MQHKTRIIVLGAGFAGIQAALILERTLDSAHFEVVIINKRPVHIYRPDLYEIATAFNKEITEECKTQLKDSVAIPLKRIFKNKQIRFIQDVVEGIDPRGKIIVLRENERLHFDYLVCSLGSVINYYGIPGLEEHAHVLKTATDAVELSCSLDALFYERWRKQIFEPLNVVIGGGGATGVELVCELAGFIDKLCTKYSYKKERVSITVIEGSGALAGTHQHGTRLILKRFAALGITCKLHTCIREVHQQSVLIESEGDRRTLPYDFLMWAGGVKPNPVMHASFLEDSLRVNEYLQLPTYPFIFAAGDNVLITDTLTGKRAPLLAQLAVDQGTLAGKNLAAYIKGNAENRRHVRKQGVAAGVVRQPMRPYIMRFKGMVIPLGGKTALFQRGGFELQGSLLWFLRRLIDLHYSMTILPRWYAIRRWIKTTFLFMKND